MLQPVCRPLSSNWCIQSTASDTGCACTSWSAVCIHTASSQLMTSSCQLPQPASRVSESAGHWHVSPSLVVVSLAGVLNCEATKFKLKLLGNQLALHETCLNPENASCIRYLLFQSRFVRFVYRRLITITASVHRSPLIVASSFVWKYVNQSIPSATRQMILTWTVLTNIAQRNNICT